jgi:hypothetical protein
VDVETVIGAGLPGARAQFVAQAEQPFFLPVFKGGDRLLAALAPPRGAVGKVQVIERAQLRIKTTIRFHHTGCPAPTFAA